MLALLVLSTGVLGVLASPTQPPTTPPPTTPPPTPPATNYFNCVNAASTDEPDLPLLLHGKPHMVLSEHKLASTIVLDLEKDCEIPEEKVVVQAIGITKVNSTGSKKGGLTVVGEFVEKDPQDGSGMLSVGGITEYRLEYNCPTGQGFEVYNVSITWDFPSPKKYHNVTTVIEKWCFPHNPPDEPSNGWTDTGVFFLCVFLVTLVLCFIGCGYNYVQLNKTGWEIVPCIHLCGRFSNARYQPQMMSTTDYDSHDNAYGATVQTNL